MQLLAYEQYMVILLKGTYYHFREIGQGTVDALLAADSMGQYFNANIRGSGSDGPFDCRTHSHRKGLYGPRGPPDSRFVFNQLCLFEPSNPAWGSNGVPLMRDLVKSPETHCNANHRRPAPGSPIEKQFHMVSVCCGRSCEPLQSSREPAIAS